MRLKILCIVHENRTVAIAPLRLSHYNFAAQLPYGVIEPLGYKRAGATGGDYTGLMFPNNETECLYTVLSYLVKHNNWDFIYLIDLPESAIDLSNLAIASKAAALKFKVETGKICPYLPLPNSIDVFNSQISKNLRQNLRKYMRKLKADYQKVEFKKYNEFDAMMIFFKLHQKRWESKKMHGVFGLQKIRDFYIDVASAYAQNGWLALYFLTANDEPIAANYSVIYDQRLYFCLGGLDPDYIKYSVGNLLHQKAIELCIANGIKEYDFLKGDEEYKFRWCTNYRRNFGIRFVNNKLASNFYYSIVTIAKQLKINRMLQN
jgi:CelD/BcsL family acetyltransferase involved in cellulose biosynthesis